jgi:hypothetical protein
MKIKQEIVDLTKLLVETYVVGYYSILYLSPFPPSKLGH